MRQAHGKTSEIFDTKVAGPFSQTADCFATAIYRGAAHHSRFPRNCFERAIEMPREELRYYQKKYTATIDLRTKGKPPPMRKKIETHLTKNAHCAKQSTSKPTPYWWEGLPPPFGGAGPSRPARADVARDRRPASPAFRAAPDPGARRTADGRVRLAGAIGHGASFAQRRAPVTRMLHTGFAPYGRAAWTASNSGAPGTKGSRRCVRDRGAI